MKRLGNKVKPSVKISLYYSMVNSHLSYLNPVWGTSASKQDLKRLQTAQNIAIRKFFYRDYYIDDMSTADIYQKYKILNVEQLIYLNKILLIYKIEKKTLKSNYSLNRVQPHEHHTRPRVRLNAFRSNVGKYSVYRSCTEAYINENNNLPTNLSLHTFKKKLKTIAIERA